MPSLIGFIVAGIIIGPHGIGLIKDIHFIQILAEIGVILLLFTIGIEFSMTNSLESRRPFWVEADAQVFLTIVISAAATYVAIGNVNQSVFFGFLYALSSTAIVLKLLIERGEIDSPHGHIMVGILIFQDICIVPLMLLIPVLSGSSINIADVGIKMGNAALIIVVVLLSARWIVPALLHQVVRTKSRELFLTTIILLCLGIALLTSRFGLSLALGAFLAGLVISESEYAHQAISDILPFKDSFMGLFFVSIGMLMDTGFVLNNVFPIAQVVAVIFFLKIITGTAAALLIGIFPGIFCSCRAWACTDWRVFVCPCSCRKSIRTCYGRILPDFPFIFSSHNDRYSFFAACGSLCSRMDGGKDPTEKTEQRGRFWRQREVRGESTTMSLSSVSV